MVYEHEMFKVDLKGRYKGTHYSVVQVLDTGFWLVVPTEDLENNNFPIQPVIVPEFSLEDEE